VADAGLDVGFAVERAAGCGMATVATSSGETDRAPQAPQKRLPSGISREQVGQRALESEQRENIIVVEGGTGVPRGLKARPPPKPSIRMGV